MYGPNLKVRIASREEIQGVPMDRLELPLDEVRKNVLLVLRVGKDLSPEEMQQAAEWLGEHCEKLSGNLASYHGVVLPESSDYVLDVVEVDK